MLETFFENERFLVVDKPVGWLSVPGRTGQADPRHCLSVELRRLYPNSLPVHRLDQEVSGLVLFAKDREAHRVANCWFESRLIHKFYEALTEGVPPEATGPLVWESRLLRGKKRAYESPHGKLSQTRATWIGTSAAAQKWLLEPLTGRSHQLRYELARHGYPILGDVLYGARISWPQGIALRAVKLDFADCTDALDYGLPVSLQAKGLSS